MEDNHHHHQEENNNNNNESSLIPPGRLPHYLSEAFGDLYEEDGLVVLGKGMGMLGLLAALCRFYADPKSNEMFHNENDDDDEEKVAGGKKATSPKTSTSEKQKKKATAGQRQKKKKQPLILIIGLKSDVERQSLVDLCHSWGTPTSLIPQFITTDCDAKERSQIYKNGGGGIYGITSRILIVDMLTGVCQASNDIDGIFVVHADNIANGISTIEAFILRIFVTQKKFASKPYFIKALSESPNDIMSGFSKVDKILKTLFVRRLYLYPRFQHNVADELDATPPIVEEVHQELTTRMKDIQITIAVAIQTCIRELKKSCPQLEWNSSTDLSNVENCVTQAFDQGISRQLQPEWHHLKPAVKQLVQDMRNLRMLFFYLLHYDCITFYKVLQNFKSISASSFSSSSRNNKTSLWLLTPAADRLFRLAKERLYIVERPKPSKRIPNPVLRLIPILEENPKWRLVQELLKEIRMGGKRKKSLQSPPNNKKKKRRNESTTTPPTKPVVPSTILIMVKDQRTLDNLRTYLVQGRERTMMLKWLNYLESINDRSRSVGTAISEEARLLLEEENRIRFILFGADNKQQRKQQHQEKSGNNNKRTTTSVVNQVPAHVRKRRRVATEQSRGRENMNAGNALDAAVDDAEHDDKVAAAKASKRKAPSSAAAVVRHDDEFDDEDDDEDSWFKLKEFGVNTSENNNSEARTATRVILKSYSSLEGDGQAHLMLQDLAPTHIILYDADLAFVRAIEIYSCLRQQDAATTPRLQLYLTLFEASAEEKTFLKSVEREQSSFERLIHHKKTMPLPVYTLSGTTQEMQLANASASGTYASGSLPLAFDTRTGRGKAMPDTEKRDIAVDVREFRSALPSILHQGGMRLAPVTLTVGDFVLSQVHCVERKSISDLFGSFASGRLYTQAESMSKYYKCPCLLIEFDPAKSFSLLNPNELGVEIRTDSITSKMALLTMHFPKLRILWSKSPHETLRIFKALKANHEEVNVDRAVEVGRSESLDEFVKETTTAKTTSQGEEVEEEEEEEVINEAARDMLLRLPGVNATIARRIMNEVESLAELAQLPRERLRQIAGPAAGQKLFTFFRQKMGSI